MEGIGTTAGAALISERTGRTCSAQNLGQIVRRGRLPDSTISMKPIRLNPATLLGEYVSKVDARQSLANNPGPGKSKAAIDNRSQHPRNPPPDSEKLPDYNTSRCRSEFEKANLLKLQRKTQEGLLLRREDSEQAWAQAVNITRTRLLGVPSTAKQRIPHLEIEEVELLTMLIREALDELASGEVKA